MSIKKFNDFSVNENLKSKEDLEKHIEDIFNNSHLSNHTPERQVDEKEGMIKAYDFLTKYFPKIDMLHMKDQLNICGKYDPMKRTLIKEQVC